MSSLSALVKELRGKTGAGILDCQKALQDTGSDIEKAIDLLRKDLSLPIFMQAPKSVYS
jgi:elongation factor Ts